MTEHNIFNRMAAWFRGKAAAQSTTGLSLMDESLGTRLAAILGGGRSLSGKVVTPESSMQISVAWSCQRILSETVGSIPWAIFERKAGGNAEQVDDIPLTDVLIHSPNRDMTSVEYREAMTLNLAQEGNTYALIDRTGASISSLYPIVSAKVQVATKERGNTALPINEGEVFYKVLDRGQWVDYPREKIWHTKGFGQNGIEGLSPIGAAREALGFAASMDDFGSVFFKQGGKPSGIVSIPNFLSPDQRVIARENLQQMLGGMANAHKFALFEGGMKPEPWGGMPLADMQFLLLKKYTVQEICRFYRIPPHMVADLDRATFSNIEQQSLEFVTYTLMPYFTRIEASAAKWLFTPEQRRKYFLRFNFEGILRADSTARSTFYQSALANGWMNRNEVRAKENLNRVDGLDAYTVQVNMTDIKNMPDPNKQPPPRVF